MITININEAKTHLSKYLKKRQVIVIAKRNIPIAEIRPLPMKKKKRKIGLAEGEFEVPPSFFEPLPKDIIEAFSGKK